MIATSLLAICALVIPAFACNSCYGPPPSDVVLTRNVRRMQPDAQGAVTGPKGPLEWGQINFLHTTDTHGWLEGHLKEKNYGADWGDFVSFTKHMKDKAASYGVDLLIVDTGDLHDGAGLSDATSPNGLVSNSVFEAIDYDLLTIGNHELYVSEIAYETFNNFSKVYGDRYLTSNVQIINPATGNFTYIGQQYRYFTTAMGLRVMAFGVLFDFTGNSNVSRVTKAATMVNQTWFQDAVNFSQPIDMFVVLGHNPPRPTVSSSTLGTVVNAIRKIRPNTPVQVFGGHTHVRDFVVYDTKATGLESGRYCETLGWLAMSGVNSTNYRGVLQPSGVPNPSMPAVKVNATASNATTTSKTSSVVSSSTIWQWPSYTPPGAPAHGPGGHGHPGGFAVQKPLPSLVYARRYLDWNRLTMEYHANGSQTQLYGPFAASSSSATPFNTAPGVSISNQITADRQILNLTSLYGCAPQSWCQTCAPFGAANNLNTLAATALAATVINSTRSTIPRMIIINTGSTRFDLAQGPFTYDDSFIVSPFADAFEYLPNVPYEAASKVLGILNAGAYLKKRDLATSDFGFEAMTLLDADSCIDPPVTRDLLKARSQAQAGGRIIRRQSTTPTPGYVTTDDFGTGGDDTIHQAIKYYAQPNALQANASFPTDGSTPATVDLIFLDYIVPNVLAALASVGANYTTSQVTYYLPKTFTTNSYLPAYAKIAWQANLNNCSVGSGVIQQSTS